MTRDEAQKHLLRYRSGTSDAIEPDIAEALALAARDAELGQWLEKHCEQQDILRSKIRRMPVPPGLKEQIISERPLATRDAAIRRAIMVAVGCIVVFVVSWWAVSFSKRPGSDETFAKYRQRMVSAALRGYGMDFESTDLAKIRLFLAQNKVMENYELPEKLRKAATAGCAIEHWQGANVAMICFRTGKPLPPGEKTDLWLFVIERGSINDAPGGESPVFAKVNKLLTATWTRGDKLYVLGVEGNEATLRNWIGG